MWHLIIFITILKKKCYLEKQTNLAMIMTDIELTIISILFFAIFIFLQYMYMPLVHSILGILLLLKSVYFNIIKKIDAEKIYN